MNVTPCFCLTTGVDPDCPTHCPNLDSEGRADARCVAQMAAKLKCDWDRSLAKEQAVEYAAAIFRLAREAVKPHD